MNHDQLNTTKSATALEDAFLVLDSIQHLPAHRQVLGVTLLFKLMADRLGLDKAELLNKADRMAYDADYRYHHHIHALRTFIDQELK